MIQPELRTPRLLLRPFRLADAEAVQELAGEEEVARNTLNIPHPYSREDAEAWILSHPDQLAQGSAATYAVTADGVVVGAVGLILAAEHGRAELGYWIGRPHWGRGFATEASRAVIAWAFRDLELDRIHAAHFPRNPASGRVLRKLGMRHEGTLRAHVRKWGEALDLEVFGLLRHEADAAGSASPGDVVE